VGLGGTVAARPPDGKIPYGVYQSLLKKREKKGWTAEEWRTAIAEKGYDFKYSDAAISVRKTDNGRRVATAERLPPVNKRDEGVGTQKLKHSKSHLKLTYLRGVGTNLLNFTWSNDDPLLGKAEKPNDFATASFESSDYDWDSRYEVDYGPEAEPSEEVKALGPSFRNAQYDANAHAGRTLGRFESYIDAQLNPTGGDKQSRKIYCEYVARWEDIVADGVNIGLGATISFSSQTGYWRAETFASEEQMDDGEQYVDKDPA
jgi:hypothetical protein